jgi:hypothetical protein
LYRVQDAVRTAVGNIVIANAGTQELRYFDLNGEFLKAVGGSGRGPGEFTQLESLHPLPGDSLAVMDWMQSRLSIFASEGEFARSAPLQPAGPGLPQIIGALDDGVLVAVIRSLMAQPPARPGFSRETSLYVAFDSDGAVRDTIAELPDFEVYMEPDASAPAPGSPFGPWAGTAAAGRHFYYGPGTAFEVRRFTETGILLRIVRWSSELRSVREEDVDDYGRRRLDEVTDPERRRGIERELARMKHPPFMPAHRSLEVDAEGYLWVESFRPTKESPALWNVFDPEDRWLGEVEVPSGLRVLEIGPDYVLGRWADDLGVEQVRLYRLRGRRF